jgi:hypothetical protein
LQPFPRSKRSRHVSAHSAFQLGLSTLEGRIRRCRRRGAPASEDCHLPSSLRYFLLQAYPDRPSPCPGHYSQALGYYAASSSIPYAGIFATLPGVHGVGVPSLHKRRGATRSCLLYAERIRDSTYGRKDPICPPPSHFGPGVSATCTCLLLRRFHRFLVVSIGHRGSPVIHRVAGRSWYIVHRLHTPRRATP